MSATEPSEPEAKAGASSSDTASDSDIEMAMSKALAPVVARVSNGEGAGGSAPEAKGEAAVPTDVKTETPAPVAAPDIPTISEPVPANTDPATLEAGPVRVQRNRVYEHLVEGEDDVIGLITYSLYKQDKRDWMIAWVAQNGSDPKADQIQAFVNAQMTAAQRDRYRNTARQVLDAYASVAVDLEKPLIVRDAISGRTEEAARRVEASGRWWRQLPAALIGALLAAAIVIAVVAILVAAGVDLAGYLGFEPAGAGDGVP